ncbi:hypothetical protein [Brachyspira hampsonii]|uniref:hypothetical protein n=1 Tax=Brachyspira hampsonii TaxID=1287055 RepID=UPI000347A6B8|nr:hypothetical protein [Brachyspira hampsonii]
MNENTSNDINNQLTSVNNKLSRSLNELNNSQQAGGIVGTMYSVDWFSDDIFLVK